MKREEEQDLVVIKLTNLGSILLFRLKQLQEAALTQMNSPTNEESFLP